MHRRHYDDPSLRPALDMTALAAKGAQQRLLELQRESEAILKQFPHLEVNGAVTAPATPKRAARRMSKASRKAISKRMKAYWRTRRSADAKAAAKHARKVAPQGRTPRGSVIMDD
jgi:hypothetical protein